MLQHVLRYFTLHCIALLYINSIPLHFTLPHFSFLYFTSLHFTLPRFTLLHFTLLYFSPLHFALHFTWLYLSLLYFTSLHFTLPQFSLLYFPSLHFSPIHFTLLYLTLLYFTSLHFTSLYFSHHVRTTWLVTLLLFIKCFPLFLSYPEKSWVCIIWVILKSLFYFVIFVLKVHFSLFYCFALFL